MSSTSCPKCSTPIPSFASKFCLKCGCKFGGSAPSTPTKPAQQSSQSEQLHAAAPSPTPAPAPAPVSTPPSTPTKPATPSTPPSSTSPSHADSSPREDGCFCEGCHGIVVGDVAMDNKGSKYHPACFACATCRVPIAGAFTYDREGKIACEACARKQLHISPQDSCSRCQKGFGSEPILVVGSHCYHKACFTCVGCGAQLEGRPFSHAEKGLMCKPCNLKAHGIICAGCHKLIEGNGIRALDKLWHDDCFICAGCNKNLAKEGRYYPEGDVPYCPECATTPPPSTTTTTTSTTHTREPAPQHHEPQHHHEQQQPQQQEHHKPKFCAECGHPATSGKFCSECGHSLVA